MGLFWVRIQVWAHNKFLGGITPIKWFFFIFFDLLIKAVKTSRRGVFFVFFPFIPQMLQNSSWKGKKKLVLSSNGFFWFEEIISITGRPAANNPLCFPGEK